MKTLDLQHQKILDELNKLYSTFETASEKEDLATTLNNLIDYANQHFSTEEGLLEKYKYHDLISQRKEHSLYQQKINDF
ncbi:hemerythrin, partial [bacterium]|nr:hemerythrin [bacterium]